MKIIKLAGISMAVGVAMLTMNAAHAQDTIKIGVIAALTGPFANIGKPFEELHLVARDQLLRRALGQIGIAAAVVAVDDFDFLAGTPCCRFCRAPTTKASSTGAHTICA